MDHSCGTQHSWVLPPEPGTAYVRISRRIPFPFAPALHQTNRAGQALSDSSGWVSPGNTTQPRSVWCLSPAVELGGILWLQMPSFRQKHRMTCAHTRCCCAVRCPNVTVALPSSNPGDVTAFSVFLYPRSLPVCCFFSVSCL